MAVRVLEVTERKLAVEAILSSRTFRRADQLRRLLAYLVEQEDAGRANELTEYEIGVKALGRSADFTPETDSSVRTRTHALRQKLEEFYRDESPGALIRVEIPRGAYTPVYREATASPEAAAPAKKPWLWIGAVAIVALSVAAAAGAIVLTRETKFDALWRPFFAKGQAVAIVVGQPVHTWVRDLRGHAEAKDYPHFPDAAPQSERFRTYYLKRAPLYPDSHLVLHPSPNAILWGDASGAASISQFLAFAGVQSELLPEATLRSEVAIRDRNLIVLGRPEFSPMSKRYLDRTGGYTVGYLADRQNYAIFRNSDPSDVFINVPPPTERSYGVITIAWDGVRRVVTFGGITSDGAAAGVEYLTNRDAIGKLWDRLHGEGYKEWPATFQIVIRNSSSDGYPVAVEYEKHLVLER